MNDNTTTLKVWDPLVRSFHWALVLAFLVAYLSGEEWEDLHVWAGYLILALVGVRVIWGFIGTRYARFSSFVTRPTVAITYLRDAVSLRAPRYLGHNPAGGLMIVALLIGLVLTGLSGMALYAVEDGAGPLAFALAGLGDFWEDTFKGVHEFFANLMIALIVFHIAGVVLESLVHGENLVRSMIDGNKRAETGGKTKQA